MRHLLVLAVLAAGCRAASPPAAPEPLPSPAPPAPPPSPGPAAPQVLPPYTIVDREYLRTCVVRNGRMEDVDIDYHAERGDTTYQGRPFHAAFPVDSTVALNADWYRDSAPIWFAGGRYVKYGLPRILGITDVVPVGTFRGVTVFVERGTSPDRPEVIYLPVDPVCDFQPYIVTGPK